MVDLEWLRPDCVEVTYRSSQRSKNANHRTTWAPALVGASLNHASADGADTRSVASKKRRKPRWLRVTIVVRDGNDVGRGVLQRNVPQRREGSKWYGGVNVSGRGQLLLYDITCCEVGRIVDDDDFLGRVRLESNAA
jgi:hypothetical protein